MKGVRNVTEYQRSVLASIAARGDFVQWVLGSGPGSVEDRLSPHLPGRPNVWLWYDTSGLLNAWRIGANRVLHTATSGEGSP